MIMNGILIGVGAVVAKVGGVLVIVAVIYGLLLIAATISQNKTKDWTK